MVEPPSKSLLDLLLGLKLCTAGDLRRCRGRVRRLARDLPAFDSVWIDALLQIRRLTPFQARVLDSPEPGRLAIGPCVLIDQLGRGPMGVTYLARRRDGNDRCVLKLIERPSETLAAGLEALGRLAGGLRRFAHPSAVAPHAALRHGNRLVTVSRYIPGPTLEELLVRRGRFPPPVVAAVARQLVDGLAALEERGHAHGDIRLANVRLTAAGVAVLVDAGIGPALCPELTIHAGLPPQRYDGIAPERIGTGHAAGSASDFYALGCLLWQLLAGRPPFTTGDPLAKLVAHQTRRVPDVREWAPDTPAPLAETIAGFTAREPEERPPSFRAVREHFGRPRRANRRRLARFRALFNTAAPRVPAAAASPRSGNWPLLVTLVFLLSGAALALFDGGARSMTLEIASRITQEIGESTGRWLGRADGDAESENRERGSGALRPPAHGAALPLPGPDAAGVILLDSPGPYEWERIDAVGPLSLRGASGVAPVIVVGENGCRIVATQVALENVHFRRAFGPDAERQDPGERRALLRIESQDLFLRNCSFDAGAPTASGERNRARSGEPRGGESAASRGLAAVAWSLLDAGDRSGGRLVMQDAVFSGAAEAVALRGTPERIDASNCLKLGGGVLFGFGTLPARGRGLYVHLRHVTLRGGRGLAAWEVGAPSVSLGSIVIEADDCIFDPAGEGAALVHWIGGRNPAAWLGALELTGEGSLINPQAAVAVAVDPDSGQTAEIDPASVRIEGLIASRFEFAGPPTRDPGDSVLRRAATRAPSSSPEPAGIAAAPLRLP